MSTIRNVCVYCGSSAGDDARFGDAAEELGRALAAEGVGLVYGGGGEGLMGRLARSTLAAGGYVTGVIPTFLIRKEHALTAAQEMVVVDTMHERKQAMFDRADAFVALPGGVGTLEELVEQLTWAQLNRHMKPILIADIGGFWRPCSRCSPICVSKASSAKASTCVTWRRKESRTCCRCCAPPRAAQPSASLRTPSLLATCSGEAQEAGDITSWAGALLSPSSRHPRERKFAPMPGEDS